MFEVSPELNSREGPALTPWSQAMDVDGGLGQHEDPTLNPWSGPMVIDDDPIQQTAGQRSGGKSSRHHPREDDSDSEPGAGYETPKGESGAEAVRVLTWPLRMLTLRQEWIRSSVRIQEVDYSSDLREQLRNSDAALAEAIRRSQELAVRASRAAHLSVLTLHIGHE